MVDVKWYLIVLICISLMTNNEHLFMLLAIYTSLEKWLCRSPFSIFNWVICLFIVELKEVFTYSGYKPLPVYDLQVFSPILASWLCPLKHKILNFDEVQFIPQVCVSFSLCIFSFTTCFDLLTKIFSNSVKSCLA